MKRKASFDPVTIEIIQSSLDAISSEMFATMRKTAMSSIIYEVLDFGVAITDREGRLASSGAGIDRKSTRLNSSHSQISYAVFCLKKKNQLARDCWPAGNRARSPGGVNRRERVGEEPRPGVARCRGSLSPPVSTDTVTDSRHFRL